MKLIVFKCIILHNVLPLCENGMQETWKMSNMMVKGKKVNRSDDEKEKRGP